MSRAAGSFGDLLRLLTVITFAALVLARVPLGAADEKKGDEKKAEEKKEPEKKDPEKRPEEGKDAPRPSLEQLLKLNSEKLFGCEPGELQVEGDRISIHYKKAGRFARGMEGSGLQNPEEIKGDANRKIVEEIPKKEGQNPVPGAVGRGDGDWQSRFELTGDAKVSFSMWARGIQKGSQLNVALHKGPKCGLVTSFFQSASVSVGGKSKRASSSNKRFLAPPEKWMHPKALVPVEMSLQGGKFTVKVENEESVSVGEVAEGAAGRLAFSFRKLTFVITDVKVSGKIDRAWYEGQLKDLEGKGELVLREKAPPPSEAPPPPRRLKKDGDPADRKKDAEEDL